MPMHRSSVIRHLVARAALALLLSHGADLLAQSEKPGTVAAPPLRPRPAPPASSTSATGQFVVHGADLTTRGAFCVLSDETAAALGRLLHDDARYLLPVIIVLKAPPETALTGPPVTWNISQLSHGGFHLQMNVQLRSDFRGDDYSRELVRILIAERILRNHKQLATPKEGETPHQVLPDWLLTGVTQALEFRSRSRPSALFAAVFRNGQVYSIDHILSANPTQLDAVTRGIYETSACALVLALLEQQDGPLRFAKFLNALAVENKPARELLKQHFPGLSASKNSLEKWWTLQMAALATPTALEAMNPDTTEAKLDEALTLVFGPLEKESKEEKKAGKKSEPESKSSKKEKTTGYILRPEIYDMLASVIGNFTSRTIAAAKESDDDEKKSKDEKKKDTKSSDKKEDSAKSKDSPKPEEKPGKLNAKPHRIGQRPEDAPKKEQPQPAKKNRKEDDAKSDKKKKEEEKAREAKAKADKEAAAKEKAAREKAEKEKAEKEREEKKKAEKAAAEKARKDEQDKKKTETKGKEEKPPEGDSKKRSAWNPINWFRGREKPAEENKEKTPDKKKSSEHAERSADTESSSKPKRPDSKPAGPPIEEFAAIMKRPDRAKILQRNIDQLNALKMQAHPLYRPLIADYIEIVRLLITGKDKNMAAKLKELRENRAKISEKARAVESYVDWYEASETRTYSGTFDDYLKLRDKLEKEIRSRNDAISKYLDSIQKEYE